MKKETEALLKSMQAPEDSHNPYSSERYSQYMQAILNEPDYEVESNKCRKGEIVEEGTINPRDLVISAVKSIAKRATGMDDSDAALISAVELNKKEARAIADAVHAGDLEYMKSGNRIKYPIQKDNAIELEMDVVPKVVSVRDSYTIPKNPGDQRVKTGKKEFTYEQHRAAKVRKACPAWLKSAKSI